MPYTTLAGFILINKPSGPTSFDCIRQLRTVLKNEDLVMGHAGTLDPFASGLMIIAIGKETTRQLALFSELSKEYLVKAKLGELRDSLDLTGNLISQQPIPPITIDDLYQAVALLGPSYEQTPPIYSALKHKGKNLYALARKGKLSKEMLESIAATRKRLIFIHYFKLLNIEHPYIHFQTHVSKGTYIRTLADDLAQRLGLRATLYALKRLSIGKAMLSSATDLTHLTTAQAIIEQCIPSEKFLPAMEIALPR